MDHLFKCKNRKNVLRKGFEVLLRNLLIGSLVKSVKSKCYTEIPETTTSNSEYQEKFVTSLTLACQKKQEKLLIMTIFNKGLKNFFNAFVCTFMRGLT